MRKLLLVALPAGLVVLAGVTVLQAFRTRGAAAEARVERARLKRDFAERAALAKALPVDRLPEWQAEVQALSRWYFEELQAIRNRHPDEPPRPTGLQAAEGERKGGLEAEARAAIEDFQKYAESRVDLLRRGSYAPAISAAADGLRLDLLGVEPGPSPMGGPGLRIDFALWGAPRFLERERAQSKTTVRNVIPLAFRKISFRFLDPAGKLYGEMTGPGEPYQKLSDPERFVDDFPPGVLFGTWWVELFPREAATVEVDLEGDVRAASGALHPVRFQASMPVPEGWKLPPGAAFQAETREAAQ